MWAWALFPLAAAVLVLGFHIADDYRRTEMREAERLLTQARVIDRNLEGIIVSADLLLKGVLEGATGLHARGADEVSAYMQALVDLNPGIRTVFITDADGAVLFSNRTELIGRDFSHREYFRRTRAGGDPEIRYISRPFETVLGVPVTNITRMVPDSAGGFGGIVAASLEPAYFRTLLDSVLYADDMMTRIVHGEGIQFVAAPEQDGTTGADLTAPDSFFSRHMESGRRETVLAEGSHLTGEDRIMAVITSRPEAVATDSPLVIMACRDRWVVFDTWRQDTAAKLIVFLIVAAMSLALAALAVRRQRAEVASEERLSIATTAANIGVWDYDLVANRLTWSDRMFALYGLAPGSRVATYEAWRDRIHPDDLARADAAFHGIADTTLPYDTEFRAVHPDGAVRHIRAYGHVLRNAQGRPLRIVGINYDITDRKRNEAELLRLNEELAASVAGLQQRQQEMETLKRLNELLQACHGREEAYPIIAALAEPLFPGCAGALAVMNPAAGLLDTVAVWGQPRCMPDSFGIEGCWALRGGHVHDVGRRSEGLICRHFRISPSGSALCLPLVVQGETIGLLHLEADTDVFPDGLRPVAESLGETVKLSLSNLEFRESLRDQAIHDALTGLFNRRYLDETLPRELHRMARNKGAICVALLDIDHFKRFNDTWGHEAGDEVLRAIGAALPKALRGSDIACRYGGEEFVVILFDVTLEGALQRVESLRKAVARLELFRNGQPLPPITISAGVAMAPLHGETPDVILRAADAALYEAKSAGRDCIRVASEPVA